jgi:sugar O-acyltransferase (sialic acid O-acetyltransferase NeuD family)
MKSSPLNVIGAGGHAKVVVRAALDQGFLIHGVFDDSSKRWGESLLGFPILGPIEKAAQFQDIPCVIAIGDNATRERVSSLLRVRYETIVHPSAIVDPTVRLGAGTVVLHRAVIQADAQVGCHAIINTAATVDHDCQIADFVHLAPGVHLAGNVSIEQGAMLGIGSVVIPARTIDAWSVVGAGAAVTDNLPSTIVAVGVPARVRKGIPRKVADSPFLPRHVA